MDVKINHLNQKSHSLGLNYRAIIKDKNGIIIHDTGEQVAKSFVIQFLQYFYGGFRGIDLNAKMTNGAGGIIYDASQPLWYSFGLLDYNDYGINYGIVVGTGDTLETNTDFKLETRIIHGGGGGQLSHGLTTVGVTGVVGDNVDLLSQRAFTNNSGGAIIVKELGIYSAFIPYATERFFCLVRDVLSTPLNVPDGCILTVVYTLRTRT